MKKAFWFTATLVLMMIGLNLLARDALPVLGGDAASWPEVVAAMIPR